MSTRIDRAPEGLDRRRHDLARRLEDAGWGLLLMMTALILLVPAEQVPPGAWLAGTGLILLGLNVARRAKAIPVSTVGIVLGALALAAGVSEFLDARLPVFALALLAVGAALVFKPLLAGRRPES